VLFRVLFAVLSFFGGVGLLAYGLAWVLIPEPEVNRSLLDAALDQLRIRRVPPWVVIIGGAVLVWLGWFSWWAPGTLPALILIAVVALVLANRLRKRPAPPPPNWTPPASAGWTPPSSAGWTPPSSAGWPVPVADAEAPAASNPAEPATTAADSSSTRLLWPTEDAGDPAAPTTEPAEAPAASENTVVLPGQSALPSEPSDPSRTATLPVWPDPTGTEPGAAGFGWQPPATGRPQPTEPLIPPLNDTRRSMQAWLAEAGQAHRVRVQRRRPIKVAVLLALLVGWGLVALLDAAFRVPFPVYLWVGLGVLGLGLLISIATRRTTLSLLIPIVILAAAAVAFGGTRASLSDGSGRIGWQPASQSQLGTYRQFAGQSTLDLTQLAPLGSAASVTITQAAGEVVLKLPDTLNATVIADVHMGDIQNGRSTAAGQFQAGLNVHLQLDPPATATGEPLTVHVSLTAGHVQVDRVG
jgi:hypothetical protein